MQDYYSVVKDLEVQLRGVVFDYKGIQLTDRDTSYMRCVLSWTLSSLYDLLPSNSLVDGIRSFRAAIPRNVHIELIQSTIDFCDDIVKHDMIAEDGSFDPTTFKRVAKSRKLAMWIVNPLAILMTLYRDTRSEYWFKCTNSFVNFLTRCNLSDISLLNDELVDYVCDEIKLSQMSYPDDLLAELNSILLEWLQDCPCNFEDIRPQHGPGTVYEAPNRKSATVLFKDSMAASDLRLEYLLKEFGGSGNFLMTVPKHLDRTCRLIFVPKKIGKKRSISAEPATLQYFQQGYRRAWYEWFHDHEYLRAHIQLDHPELSQHLCWEGSVAGEYATIDLTKASDYITMPLIKSIFKHTSFLKPCICTRSDKCNLGDFSITLTKFAPMGSALCFPVQTLIFSLFVEYSLRRKFGRHHRKRYTVYGDDIVLPQAAAEVLINSLERCHFIPNRSKSFATCNVNNFREACGKEYLNGIDVSPSRVPRFVSMINITERGSKASTVASLTAFAQNAYDADMMYLRKAILWQLEALIGRSDFNHLPRSMSGRIGIKTNILYCTNWHTRHRFLMKSKGSTYQRLEARCLTLVSKPDTRVLHQSPYALAAYDYVAYMHWLIQMSGHDPTYVGNIGESGREIGFLSGMLPSISQLRYTWCFVD